MSISPLIPALAEQDLLHIFDQAGDLPFYGPYLSAGQRLRTLGCGGGERSAWPAHQHSEHEIFWGVRGHAIVVTPDRLTILQPGMALWVPAEHPHAMYIAPETSVNCTLVSQELVTEWQEVRTFAMPGAAAQLLETLAYTPLPPELRGNIEDVVLGLITLNDAVELQLPLPRDVRLLRVVEAVLSNPAIDRSLACWSAIAAMSERNFTRRFRFETGMSFGDWRVMARMRVAQTSLRDGQPIQRVASAVGYNTVSAFTSAYRRSIGRTPARDANWPVGDRDWPHAAQLDA